MKKEYAAPRADTQIFETEDIIMASGEFDMNPEVSQEDTEEATVAN